MAETLDDIAIAIAGLTTEPVPAVPSPALSETLAGLRKHYTMEAERQAHDALFPGAAASSIVASADEPEAELDMADFML
ncbi:hypothetical protein D3C72_2220160 [compost metagenome]